MLSSLLFSVAVQQAVAPETLDIDNPGFYELQRMIYDSHKKLSDVMLKHDVVSAGPAGPTTGTVVKKSLDDVFRARITFKGSQALDAEHHVTKHRSVMINHSQKTFITKPFPVPIPRRTKRWNRSSLEPDEGRLTFNFAEECHQVIFHPNQVITLQGKTEGEFEVMKNGALTMLPAITFSYNLEAPGPARKSATITVSSNPLLLLELTLSKADDEGSVPQEIHNYKLKEIVTNAGFTSADTDLAPDALKGYRIGVGQIY
jgi:hypothetical protein